VKNVAKHSSRLGQGGNAEAGFIKLWFVGHGIHSTAFVSFLLCGERETRAEKKTGTDGAGANFGREAS